MDPQFLAQTKVKSLGPQLLKQKRSGHPPEDDQREYILCITHYKPSRLVSTGSIGSFKPISIKGGFSIHYFGGKFEKFKHQFKTWSRTGDPEEDQGEHFFSYRRSKLAIRDAVWSLGLMGSIECINLEMWVLKPIIL